MQTTVNIRCNLCGGVLNPYCQVDYAGKMWMCPICHSRNNFPAHYAGISEQNVPAELFPQYTTIEYVSPTANAALKATGSAGNPAYVFVIDTVLPDEEITALSTSITQMLSLLPENALVGLITFGTQVHVYELGFTESVRSFCFKGSKSVDMDAVRSSLGLIRQQQPGTTCARSCPAGAGFRASACTWPTRSPMGPCSS